MTPSRVATALVLVDDQYDFFDRPNLVPDAVSIQKHLAALLEGFRQHRSPVAHVHTKVRADGSDRMPHWIADGRWACVDGTDGALPPTELAPADDELVVSKQFFSGFAGGALDKWLRDHGVGRVVLAGLYLHACVRSTALDAYELGYDVWIADDAVGTTDAAHGVFSRKWLQGRAARFVSVADVLGSLDTEVVASSTSIASEVRAATETARRAQMQWAATDIRERVALLERWASELETNAARLVELVIESVGKPRSAAEDELRRTTAHIRSAIALTDTFGSPRGLASQVSVRHQPVGVVGLILPWNNPVALLVGKLAPALAFGNAAIVKPSPEASAVALAVLELLDRAGAPTGLAPVILGARDAGEAVCDDEGIDAVAVTGSIATGRTIVARCASSAKPVQAELGGNNAAIVLADVDLDLVVPSLIRSCFAFAGQRCTAIRRFVVERSIADRFETLAAEATRRIVVGDPHDPSTEVGPLISPEAGARVRAVIERAVSEGAHIIARGEVPGGLQCESWLAPTLLGGVAPESAVAQEETFGPVAVVLVVDDIDEAIAVANGVPHGLVLQIVTGDPLAQRRILAEGQAGIVQIGAGPLPISADAPFVGWKASGIGPPEHGEWDAAFYTRPQAVYGEPPW